MLLQSVFGSFLDRFGSFFNFCFEFKGIDYLQQTLISNPYIFGFQRRKPLKFQSMTFVRSKNISLKYQRFTTLGSKDIWIRKSEFVAKSQFLLKKQTLTEYFEFWEV